MTEIIKLYIWIGLKGEKKKKEKIWIRILISESI